MSTKSIGKHNTKKVHGTTVRNWFSRLSTWRRSNALLAITSASTRPPTAAGDASSRLFMRNRPPGPPTQIEYCKTKHERTNQRGSPVMRSALPDLCLALRAPTALTDGSKPKLFQIISICLPIIVSFPFVGICPSIFLLVAIEFSIYRSLYFYTHISLKGESIPSTLFQKQCWRKKTQRSSEKYFY